MLQVLQIKSLESLRELSDVWDNLWLRSRATLPTLRAELLAQWVERFGRPADFFAVAVGTPDKLAAALPLVGHRVGTTASHADSRHAGHVGTSRLRRVYPFSRAAALPCNEWSASGDLLLDEDADAEPALRDLVGGIRDSGIRLLWLDEVELDAPRWRRFLDLCSASGMTVAERRRWQVGRVATDDDWDSYRARWSRKHRQKMAHSARRLAELGEVRLDVDSRLPFEKVAPLMRRCFEIEDSGWKGKAGTSVLRTPGMAEFYIGQARQAAKLGQLEIVTLYCGERPISFSYGLTAKGVFHSTKIGYDPRFADYQPGQLLRYFLLERYFADPERKFFDFQGPMTPSHEAWLPELYTIGRAIVAPRGLPERIAVWAYKRIWPWASGWAQRS